MAPFYSTGISGLSEEKRKTGSLIITIQYVCPEYVWGHRGGRGGGRFSLGLRREWGGGQKVSLKENDTYSGLLLNYCVLKPWCVL